MGQQHLFRSQQLDSGLTTVASLLHHMQVVERYFTRGTAVKPHHDITRHGHTQVMLVQSSLLQGISGNRNVQQLLHVHV